MEKSRRDSIAALQTEWRALQAQCPQASPYQTWEWNHIWWRHYGSRKRLRLLEFYAVEASSTRSDSSSENHSKAGIKRQSGSESGGVAAGKLVGIAPLYTSRHLGTPLRRLAWVGTGQSDYLDLLVLPEYASEVAEALRQHLEGGLRGWDIADLQQLRDDSHLHEQSVPTVSPNFLDQPEKHSTKRSEAQTQSLLPMEPCPHLPLPDTWEAVTARLGKKMRSNLGYYDRLLHKTFSDANYALANAETLPKGMTSLFELHQKRWNARWLPGVLGGKKVQAFHRDIAACFLERGWLRLHTLAVEGDIRAALYCFAYADRTYYYLGGFAPELGKYSLGTLLTGHAIRHAIAEQHTEFDFLRGNEPYKYRWLPNERINHRLLILRTYDRLGGLGELPGRAGFALNRVERYVEHRAKAFAEQQGRREKEREPEKAVAASNDKSSHINKSVDRDKSGMLDKAEDRHVDRSSGRSLQNSKESQSVGEFDSAGISGSGTVQTTQIKAIGIKQGQRVSERDTKPSGAAHVARNTKP